LVVLQEGPVLFDDLGIKSGQSVGAVEIMGPIDDIFAAANGLWIRAVSEIEKGIITRRRLA
jgi:hypothetical protein